MILRTAAKIVVALTFGANSCECIAKCRSPPDRMAPSQIQYYVDNPTILGVIDLNNDIQQVYLSRLLSYIILEDVSRLDLLNKVLKQSGPRHMRALGVALSRAVSYCRGYDAKFIQEVSNFVSKSDDGNLKEYYLRDLGDSSGGIPIGEGLKGISGAHSPSSPSALNLSRDPEKSYTLELDDPFSEPRIK
jgi:hypothetical protein